MTITITEYDSGRQTLIEFVGPITSQQLDEVERLAHRIVLLDRGRVVASGSADALKRHVGGDVLEVRVTDDAGRLDG